MPKPLLFQMLAFFRVVENHDAISAIFKQPVVHANVDAFVRPSVSAANESPVTLETPSELMKYVAENAGSVRLFLANRSGEEPGKFINYSDWDAK